MSGNFWAKTRGLFGLALAITPAFAAVGQSAGTGTTAETRLAVGSTAQTGSGRVGQRRSADGSILNPNDRLESRLATRIETRIDSRLDNTRAAAASGIDSFGASAAEFRNKRTSRRR